MYYGIYKDVRNSAWSCLYDFKIDRLPVDVLSIARMSGIHVIKNSSVGVLAPSERGKSFFDGRAWVIVYDDSCSTLASRYTVAHELGHIFLGHPLKTVKYGSVCEFDRLPAAERQANAFAERILCPACVIWGLDLHSAQEIADYCRVELSVAEKRAKRMCTLYKRQRFLTSKYERDVYEGFCEYIEEMHNVYKNTTQVF